MRVIVYSVLFITYVYFSVTCRTTSVYWVGVVAGALPIVISLVDSLQANSLRVYLVLNRIWNEIVNPTLKWDVSANFEGDVAGTVIADLHDIVFVEKAVSKHVKLIQKKPTALSFRYNETLLIDIEYLNPELHGRVRGAVHLIVHPFEIGYRASKQKISREIAPLLESIKKGISVDMESYSLNIEFRNRNPFMGLFVKHLKYDEIENFQIDFASRKYCPEGKSDRISVSKKSMHIMTSSVNSLKELANDFITLSTELNQYVLRGDDAGIV